MADETTDETTPVKKPRKRAPRKKAAPKEETVVQQDVVGAEPHVFGVSDPEPVSDEPVVADEPQTLAERAEEPVEEEVVEERRRRPNYIVNLAGILPGPPYHPATSDVPPPTPSIPGDPENIPQEWVEREDGVEPVVGDNRVSDEDRVRVRDDDRVRADDVE